MIDEIKAEQDITKAKIADLKVLMEKIVAILSAGMTPEKEAQLADVLATQKAINEDIGTIQPPTA